MARFQTMTTKTLRFEIDLFDLVFLSRVNPDYSNIILEISKFFQFHPSYQGG